MRILALETSGSAGEVAALVDDTLLAEVRLAAGQRTAQSLAPAIRDLLSQVGWKLADVQLVAVSVGPGSFTGLRIGVTTAKTFAYAVGAEVLGVDTLEVIASQAPADLPRVAAAIDAQRGQVYAAEFARDESGDLRRIRETAIVDAAAWLDSLSGRVALSGPALATLGAQLPRGVRIVPAELWQPTARSVGRLALARYAAGRRDDVFQLVPLYLRRSAAEEKWETRGGTP